MNKSPVVVTSAHTRIGFNVAQSLIRAGHPVVAVGRYRPTMCAGLARVVAEYAHGDPFEDTVRYVDLLLEVASRHGTDLIFPVHEEIYAIAEHADAIRLRQVQVCGPSLQHLLQLHDKANVSRFAEQSGVRFPRTVVPDGADDLDEVLSVIGPSFIVKPRWGSGTSGVMRVAGTKAVNALRALWRREKPGRRYVVQELVPGCGAGVGVLVHAGQVVACGGHKRVREIPISGGTSTARVTLQSPAMEKAALAAVKASGFDNGVCMVEFRYHEASGKFWLLEFNPRYWGGLSTAILSGVDFPALHLACHTGVPREVNQRAPTLSETRWMLGELRAMAELAKAKQWRTLAGVFRTAPEHRLYFEDFGPGRFVAFGSELLGYLRAFIGYGNFGQHSVKKDAFFERMIANYSEDAI